MFKKIIKKLIFRVKYPTCIIKGDVSLNSWFEGNNVIHKNTRFSGKIGFGSYIGRYSNINAYIGRFCSIGYNVKTIFDTHPSQKFVSSHPIFYSTTKQCGETFVTTQKYTEQIYADAENKYAVIIGNDVWIGDNVTIVGGVTICDGAIIGANALVTKDVAPYTIVGGVPAKTIRKRFDDQTVLWLEQYKWWDHPISWIKENANEFEDIERFVKKFKKGNQP